MHINKRMRLEKFMLCSGNSIIRICGKRRACTDRLGLAKGFEWQDEQCVLTCSCWGALEDF